MNDSYFSKNLRDCIKNYKLDNSKRIDQKAVLQEWASQCEANQDEQSTGGLKRMYWLL